jgi:predicted phosphodiesterase
MRVLIISDPHANFVALNALDDLLREADRVVCLGDVVGYYAQPNEVCDYLRDLKALCIRGNHDHYALTACPPHLPEGVKWGIAHAQRTLTAENLTWLASLPLSWGGFLGEMSALLVHGAPWSPLEAYLYADNPRLVELDTYEYDLVAFGQTHRALLKDGQRPLILNPGAVGQSRDGAAEACAAVLETRTRSITLARRDYDPAPVMQLARSHGAGDWITKHLI